MFAHKTNKAIESASQEAEEKEESIAASKSLGVGQVVDVENSENVEAGQETQVVLDQGVPVNEGDDCAVNEVEDNGEPKDDKEEGAAAPNNIDDPTLEDGDNDAGDEPITTEENMRRLVEERNESETVCKLLRANTSAKCCPCWGKCCCSCCGCGSEKEEEKKAGHPAMNCGERTLCVCKWFFAILINVFCLYFTIVNIGATSEMELVNYHLPNATRNLYPPE